jgi:hypothetical protein
MKASVLPLIAVLGAAAVLGACASGGAQPCIETMPGMKMCPNFARQFVPGHERRYELGSASLLGRLNAEGGVRGDGIHGGRG